MAAHRYWRVYIEENGGSIISTDIMEVEMYESALGENVCAGGSAISSGDNSPGEGKQFAFDGDFSTNAHNRWASSNPTDCWIGYDFGAGNDKDILAVGIWASTTTINRVPDDFRVEFSDDGTNWTTLFRVDNQAASWVGYEYRRFVHPSFTPPSFSPYPYGSHEYWRLVGLPENDDSVAAGEMEMRASVGGADQCTGGTATASSNFSGSFNAPKAFDDNTSTLWSTDTGQIGAWIEYQFSSPVDVVQVLIRARHDTLARQTYETFGLQYSDDGVTWTTAWAHKGETGWTTNEERLFVDSEDYVAGVGATPPATPSILSVTADEDSITGASSSSFSAGEGGSHTASRWQIRRESDGVTILDTTSSTFLTSFVGGSLEGGKDYSLRVAYEEDSTTFSAFSSWFAFTALAPSDIRYVLVVTGDRIWMSGRSRKQNASDHTTLNYFLRLYDGDKSFVKSVLMCSWPSDEEVEFRQGNYIVQAGEVYAHVRATSVLDDQRRGLDFLDGGINAPEHGISAALVVNTPNAGFQWEAAIQCRIRYVMNTTGHVSSQEVDENGTWANTTHATEGTEDNALTGLSDGDPVYLTIVGYDNPNDPGSGEHRRSPRLLVGPITAGAASSLLLTDGSSLIQTDASDLLLTG